MIDLFEGHALGLRNTDGNRVMLSIENPIPVTERAVYFGRRKVRPPIRCRPRQSVCVRTGWIHSLVHDDEMAGLLLSGGPGPVVAMRYRCDVSPSSARPQTTVAAVHLCSPAR